MSPPMPHPSHFLELRVHDELRLPGLFGICAGYESGEWRSAQLARHLVEWLPEFALTHREIAAIGAHNAVSLVARAAQLIYDTRTASPRARDRRGEIGELLLHIVIRQVFNTVPAISKLYYKDAANVTVKGFDAVHVVASATSLELWLGEAKFHTDINTAIRDVVAELAAHTRRDYLRSEFALITNKIDPTWPHADRLQLLLSPNTSLDAVFDRMVIPVLLTYDSPVICTHVALSDEFQAEYEREVRTHHGRFASSGLPSRVRIHLFLFPMKSKKSLVAEFDRRLQACQSMGH